MKKTAWNKGIRKTEDDSICLYCGSFFHVKPSQKKIGKGKYCSKKCYMKVRSGWMKDKSFNHAYKVDFKGKKNPNYKGDTRKRCVDCGKVLGYQNYARCRECNYKFLFGENYKANIEGFRKYPIGWNKTFKEQIRYRDGYRCQLCGIPEAECSTSLHVHHIDYEKMNINDSNLISLCNSCHAKTNSNREYWKQYFSPKEVMPYEKSSNN